MIRSWTLAAAVAAALLAACAGGNEQASSVDLHETTTIGEGILGADRVGDVLRNGTGEIPTNLAGVEAMFGVGRACARTDSQEVYIVEETHGRRPDGTVIGGDSPIPLLPRAVIAGCNTGDTHDVRTQAISYGFFIALVSDPDRAHSNAGDGMLLDNVEVMTFDRETSTYNFYIFGHDAVGQPQLRRIFRRDDGTVYERALNQGATVASQPAETASKCFGCHVNGDPFMNEMREPWTNWISARKLTELSQVSGATEDLVSRAVSHPAANASTNAASFAGDLEPVMRAAINAHVGDGEKGFASQLAKRPGGVAQLFDSVFCQTELNFGSSTDAVPIEIYLDPSFASDDFVAPSAATGSTFQLPIRAEFDQSVERWLENQGYLTRYLTQAIRLLDDENDIFSDARCEPFKTDLRAKLAGAPDKTALQALLVEHLTGHAIPSDQPKRLAYLKLLLDPTATQAAVVAGRTDYRTELAVRFAKMKADPMRIATRESDRKARALAMFPGATSPLPLMSVRPSP